MNIFIPKMITVKKASKNNNSKKIKDTKYSAKETDYISEGIEIEEINEEILDYPKDKDAYYGYYNNRNIWINY